MHNEFGVHRGLKDRPPLFKLPVKGLCVGEAAGLQDFLWGFGMRYALRSGFLAARSMIDGTDYEKEANKEFRNNLRAGIVNRYLWENARKNDFSPLINNSELVRKSLRSFYNYNPLQRIIYPLALASVRRKYRNLGI